MTERGRPLAVVRPSRTRNEAESIIQRLEAAGLLRPASKRETLPAWKPRIVRGVPLPEPFAKKGMTGDVGAWAYFDTSVLVKRHVKEEGSTAARHLLQRYRFLSLAVAPVEVLSTLSRRRTAGELTQRDFHAIRSRLHKDRRYWELVEVGAMVLSEAPRAPARGILKWMAELSVAFSPPFQPS